MRRVIATGCAVWVIILYQVVVIVLKLNDAITWEWRQVLLPAIVYAALSAAVLILTSELSIIYLIHRSKYEQ